METRGRRGVQADGRDPASRGSVASRRTASASIVAAALFALLAPVDWSAVLPLAAGLFLGSTIGPRAARRLPAGVLRWLVALLGLAFAIKLWLSPP